MRYIDDIQRSTAFYCYQMSAKDAVHIQILLHAGRYTRFIVVSLLFPFNADNSITGFRIPTSVDKSSIQVRNRAVSTNTIYCDVYFIVCSSYEQFCLQICSTMQASVPIYLLLCGLDRDYILYQRFHNFELDCYDLH